VGRAGPKTQFEDRVSDPDSTMGALEDPMYSPLSRIAVRLAYGARQLPRVSWYVGHGLAMRRLAKAAPRRDGALVPRRRRTTAPVPDRTQIA
jgi:hypothetical protein